MNKKGDGTCETGFYRVTECGSVGSPGTSLPLEKGGEGKERYSK